MNLFCAVARSLEGVHHIEVRAVDNPAGHIRAGRRGFLVAGTPGRSWEDTGCMGRTSWVV